MGTKNNTYTYNQKVSVIISGTHNEERVLREVKTHKAYFKQGEQRDTMSNLPDDFMLHR